MMFCNAQRLYLLSSTAIVIKQSLQSLPYIILFNITGLKSCTGSEFKIPEGETRTEFYDNLN